MPCVTVTASEKKKTDESRVAHICNDLHHVVFSGRRRISKRACSQGNFDYSSLTCKSCSICSMDYSSLTFGYYIQLLTDFGKSRNKNKVICQFSIIKISILRHENEPCGGTARWLWRKLKLCILCLFVTVCLKYIWHVVYSLVWKSLSFIDIYYKLHSKSKGCVGSLISNWYFSRHTTSCSWFV